MRKERLALLTLLFFSLILFLSGCGFINQPPNASFSVSSTSGEAPVEVSFDASSSSDPDGDVISYDWDFGDGSTGTGKTVNHTYDSTDDYQVKLTVTDGGGLTDSESMVISIGTQTGTNQSPEANFSCQPLERSPRTNVECDASDSTDPDGTIVEYLWRIKALSDVPGQFQEISKSGEEIVYYTGGRTFLPCEWGIKLTIKDGDGATDVQSESVKFS